MNISLEAILYWILFGALIGFIVDFLDKKHKGGLVINIIIGIIGSIVGGFIADLLGFRVDGGFNLANILVSIGGAFLVVIAYRWIQKR